MKIFEKLVNALTENKGKNSKNTKDSKNSKCMCGCSCGHGHKGHMIYGIGFLGALMYYMPSATGSWGYVMALLKSIFWPAFLVKALLKFFGA